MDRSWMYGPRNTTPFLSGLRQFIDKAVAYQKQQGHDRMNCPCKICRNLSKETNVNIIFAHLLRRGFRENYYVWTLHGESRVDDGATTSLTDHVNLKRKADEMGSSSNIGAQREDALNSTYDNERADNESIDHDNDRVDDLLTDVKGNFDTQPKAYASLMDAANTPLYPDSTFSKLSAVLKLYHLKAKHGWTNSSFTELLEALREMYPGSTLPSTNYETRKLMFEHFLDEDTESSGSSTANSYWLCARTRLDDKKELICPNPFLEPLLKKLDEVKESVAKGEFVPCGKDDILSDIVGKPGHSGRNRGMGGVEGYSEIFGRGKRSVFVDKPVFNEEQVRQMEKKIESRLMVQMRLELQEHLSRAGIQVDDAPAKAFSPGMQESKCSNINARMLSFNDGDKCFLGLKKNGNGMVEIVGHADVYNTLPNQMLHNIPMLPNHLRVNIKMVIDGFERRLLPVGIDNAGISLLAEAVGTFVQWPSDLVFVGQAPLLSKERSMKKVVKQKCDQKPPQLVLGNPLVDELNKLRGDVLEMHEILAMFDPQMCQFSIPLSRHLFHYPSDDKFSSIVTREDLRQFCNGDSLNISIIQGFIMCMSSKMQADGVTNIGFLCPEICSHARLTTDRATTRNYIAQALSACFNKNLVLFPYHQSSHWILIIICPRTSTAFIFDPAFAPKISVQEDVTVAFRVASMLNNQRTTTLPKTFEKVQCRKQPGATECGYYVMRYMYDIINNYHDSENIGRDWIAQQGSYSTLEIDEVRDVWARYFLDFLLN